MRPPEDPELTQRRRLLHQLSTWREMLPGSFVTVRRRCGKPTCRCADGVHLHTAFQLSVVVDGKPRAFHVPPAWAAEVRERVEMAKRFHEAAATICQINLRRWLRRKAAARKPP
jgi:hypothetical protein